MRSIHLSCGSYKTLPQHRWIKTTELYSPIPLKAKSPKPVSLGWHQGVGKDILTLEILEENIFPACPGFWWLPAFFSFLLSSRTPIIHLVTYFRVSHLFLRLCSFFLFFPFLFVKLENLNWPIFKLFHSFLCHSKSPTEYHMWIFFISIVTFHL